MSIPAFLVPGSPPRSPHGPPPGSFNNYFATPTTPARGNHLAFRPTRRDLLLCLLTLSFSYLLFSPTPAAEYIPHQVPSASLAATEAPKYKLPSWASIWHPSAQIDCPLPSPGNAKMTFSESVRPQGITYSPTENKWDGGEDEDEDDEIISGATLLRGHSPGWTLADKLYIYNGSFYVVTNDPKQWPELRLMTSTGLPANSEPGNEAAREPKGHEILYIKPAEAASLWGKRVYQMQGTTWLFNDGQFIDHYYHFAAELLLGSWRTYASLDIDITPHGETSLAPPERIWFLHQNITDWRDGPRFNPTITSALFPSTAFLYPDDFRDLQASSKSYEPSAIVLERALLSDRSAAFRGPYTGPTSRTVAGALHVGEVSRWWWEPLRRQVLRYAGVTEDVLNRNLEGYGAVDPATLEFEHPVGPGIADLEPLMPQGSYKPVVTYISRQHSRRRLTPEAHRDLVAALEDRAKKIGFELVIVEAERMTKEEQFALAARTTIMLGVHGNGLTHLLWMPATPRSAVIEMFFKGGFARDYQWTAHALGIRHFAVQHDKHHTSPNTPEVAYPEGFQGEKITVVGKVVADLIEERLAGKI